MALLSTILSLLLSVGWGKTLLVFDSACSMKPLSGKKNPMGEDSPYDDFNLLIVSDGVGGWGRQGVDVSLYSYNLTALARDNFYLDVRKYSRKPKKLLIKAASLNKNLGSSTMVIVTLWKRKLRASFIGDSQFLLLRRGPEGFKAIYESETQQYKFNFPFQVGTNGTDPAKALSYAAPVVAGDLVVVGSDGLFDNLSPDNIVKIVNNSNGLSSKQIADLLLEKALECAYDQACTSPFSAQARQSGEDHPGGKQDDTTVIVAYIDEIK